MAEVTFDATEGQLYYIAVDSHQNEAGFTDPGDISISIIDLGGGTSLPNDAHGVLDFLNNGYQYDAYAHYLDEVVDHPEYNVPGVGLWLTEFSETRTSEIANLMSHFLDHALTANFSIIFDVYYINNTFAAPMNMSVQTNGIGSPYLGMETETGEFGYLLFYDYGPGFSNERDALDFDGPILPHEPELHIGHRIGITRTNSRIAAFVNGALIDTVETDQAPAVWTRAMLGGDGNGMFSTILIGRIEFYSELDDATMQTYTAQPNVFDGIRPENDDFADATLLLLDEPAVGHNFFATSEYGEPDHSGNGNTFDDEGGSSVWWKFIAPQEQTYQVSTNNSSDLAGYGHFLVIYTGDSVDDLTEVAADREGYPYTLASWDATPGVTYYVCITGFREGLGTLVVTVSEV